VREGEREGRRREGEGRDGGEEGGGRRVGQRERDIANFSETLQNKCTCRWLTAQAT